MYIQKHTPCSSHFILLNDINKLDMRLLKLLLSLHKAHLAGVTDCSYKEADTPTPTHRGESSAGCGRRCRRENEKENKAAGGWGWRGSASCFSVPESVKHEGVLCALRKGQVGQLAPSLHLGKWVPCFWM